MPGFGVQMGDSEPSGVSVTSGVVLQQFAKAYTHFWAPVSREPIPCKFADLAATWREEAGFSSSLTDLVLSPSYQRIIGLGKDVVPSILIELMRKPDHWFWALTAITGVDPVPPNAAGNLQEMTAAWVRWGEEQGLLD